MTRSRQWLLVCLPVAAFLSGCATTESPGTVNANDNMDAVLWVQSSTEYAAAAAGTYAAATAALPGLVQADSGRGLAVVLDIDETVLDNSRYQGELVENNASYNSASWDQWIERRDADAVPGVVDFIRASQAQGLHVAFITNRACRKRPDSADDCPQKEDTLANLEDIGIDAKSTTLFLRGEVPPEECLPLLTGAEQAAGVWSSDKTSRRACVGIDHDIAMLFGDQLGDFTEIDEDSSTASAHATAARFEEHWGKTWFMLPNPTYGDWRPGSWDEKQELLKSID